MKSLHNNVTGGMQKGFTLIELVIVIVIIGILAAVAIPNLTGATDEAKKAKNNSALAAARSAWSIAYAANKAVPFTSQVVALMTTEPVCVGGAASTAASTAVCTFSGTDAQKFTLNFAAGNASPMAITCATGAGDDTGLGC